MLLLRDCSLNLSSLLRHQSWASGNDDRSCDSRHDFGSDCAENTNGDDVGFEIDVWVSETSLAMKQLVVADSRGAYSEPFLEQ